MMNYSQEVRDNYVLYIWVRTDKDSMCQGKAAAQVAHAATMLAVHVESHDADDTQLKNEYQRWLNQANGNFGTTLVMNGYNLSTMKGIESYVGGITDTISDEKENFVFYDWVVDPTYPIQDGEDLVLVETTTCFWCFTNIKIPGVLL